MLEVISSWRVVGLFSSWLANKNRHKTKWWESRLTAYQSVIESLSDLVHFHECCWDDLCHRRELSDEVIEQRNQANTKIKKLVSTGEFYFSDKANSTLKAFLANGEVDSNSDNPSDIIDDIHANIANAKNCLHTFIECSKVDLKVKPSVMDKFF
jgi:hypothetical protein